MIESSHSIYSSNTCCFGNLLKNLQKTRNLKEKINEIHSCMHNHIFNEEILAKIEQIIAESVEMSKTKSEDQMRKYFMKHCEGITCSWHQGRVRANLPGDIEFIH